MSEKVSKDYYAGVLRGTEDERKRIIAFVKDHCVCEHDRGELTHLCDYCDLGNLIEGT